MKKVGAALDRAEDILFDRLGGCGVVTLSRPRSLNALTLEMCRDLRRTLLDWADDDGIVCVVIRGAGDRAFCAGADIRRLHDEAKRDPVGASRFFHEEYRLNALIHRHAKPYVALIDGIVMGGGVGLSVHGSFRVAGDRTLFAMPETGIGLFPDVGGGYFLPRLEGGLGLYLALTGARADAADCLAAGIATHFTPSDRTGDLLAGLSRASNASDVKAILDRFAVTPPPAMIEARRADIARLFGDPSDFDAFWRRLERDESDFAIETLATLGRMSPTSMKVTFEQMRRGARLSFDDVMRMEYRIARRCMEGRDFFEGVRAQVIDKDRQPRWSPATLSAVSDADVARYFEPLPDMELELP